MAEKFFYSFDSYVFRIECVVTSSVIHDGAAAYKARLRTDGALDPYILVLPHDHDI